jgi:hypothetical protein
MKSEVLQQAACINTRKHTQQFFGEGKRELGEDLGRHSWEVPLARADSRGFLLLGSVILAYDIPILSLSVVYSLIYMNVAFVAGTFFISPRKILSLHLKMLIVLEPYQKPVLRYFTVMCNIVVVDLHEMDRALTVIFVFRDMNSTTQ